MEGGAGAGHVLEHLRRRGLRCGPCAGRLDLAGLRRQFVERRRAHAVRLPAALAAHDADQDPPAGSDRPQISQLERQLPVRSGAERLGHRPPERARFGPAYREDVSRRALPPRQHGQPAFVGRTGVLQLHDARRRQRRKLAAAVHLLRFPLRGSRGCGARGRAQSERPARDRRADRAAHDQLGRAGRHVRVLQPAFQSNLHVDRLGYPQQFFQRIHRLSPPRETRLARAVASDRPVDPIRLRYLAGLSENRRRHGDGPARGRNDSDHRAAVHRLRRRIPRHAGMGQRLHPAALLPLPLVRRRPADARELRPDGRLHRLLSSKATDISWPTDWATGAT